jgi:DNA end-binding protein Ku
MAPRSSASVTVTFGLLSVPAKLFTAVSEKSVSFEQQHAECGGKVRQQHVCVEHDAVIPREAMVKAFAVERGKRVTFTDDELTRLKSPRTDELELQVFMPRGAVDAIFFAKTYFVGAGDGGEAGYSLLVDSLNDVGAIAIGRLFTRGRDQLVLLESNGERLLLRELYYANEVRSHGETVPVSERVESPEHNRTLARQIIQQSWQTEFAPDQFRDTYPERVRVAAAEKVAGRDVPVPEAVPERKVVSLVDALRGTLAAKGVAPLAAPSDVPKRKGIASVRSLQAAAHVSEDAASESQRSGSTGS